MYFRSQSNLSSQEIALRPFTCANPLNPGLAVCLFLCSSSMKTISRTNCGLGPIRVIVPFNMLNTSGNSSRLVFLSHFPNFVNLISSGRSSPFLSLSSVIVLNLYILNIVSFPSNPTKPGLSCLNKTGVPNLILTRSATLR